MIVIVPCILANIGDLIAAQDQLCQLHLHVQRVVGALELQHQDAVGVAEDAWRPRHGKRRNHGKTTGITMGKP